MIRCAVWCCGVLLAPCRAIGQDAATVLMRPAGIVFDGAGGLYIAEAGRHVVDRLDPSGTLTIVAGDGTQGFGGDGGQAVAAELDSPQGLALDPAGNLLIADAHNHRVRMVNVTTGVISTIAGSGVTGFAGDSGAATATRMSLPCALAVDAAGNVYIADAGDHRVRRVAAGTGLISTVAGDGLEGFAGDGGLATAASLDTPGGLAVDAAGNVYIGDTHNQRVRRVDAVTGRISTLTAGVGQPVGLSVDGLGNAYVADRFGHRVVRLAADGTLQVIAATGVEGFAGDGGAAVAALADGPKATAVSPAGLLTLADTRNERVRQVDAAGLIHTLVGTGGEVSAAGQLVLSAPATVVYGTGTLTATLQAEAGATGSVSFYDLSSGSRVLLGTGALQAGEARFAVSAIAVGVHSLLAIYSGNGSYAAAQSSVTILTVTPATVIATAVPVSMVYGNAVPVFSGSMSGIFLQDVGSVSVVFSSGTTSFSPVGLYPIVAVLAGAGAANYAVTQSPASGELTVGQANTAISLGSSALQVAAGNPVTLTARVVPATQGSPSGKISFLDGATALQSVAADSTGAAQAAVTLSAGNHLLSAVYGGDGNFIGSSSGTIDEVVTAAATTDFALSSSGAATVTVTSGSPASYAFAVQVQNGPMVGPILLTATGLPTGATATFSPAYLPPGASAPTFSMTVQTPVAVAWRRGLGPRLAGIFAGALLWGFARRRRLLQRGAMLALLMVGMAGCGDRKAALTSSAITSVSYTITVTGTSTAASGAVLQHSSVVTLIVQSSG